MTAFIPTAAQLERVEMLAAEGKTQAEIGAALGVSGQTIYRHCIGAYRAGHDRAPPRGPQGPRRNAVYARPSYAAGVSTPNQRSRHYGH